MINLDLLQYLSNVERLGFDPNFFMSAPYLSMFPDIRTVVSNGWIWLEDDEWCLFPPMPTGDRLEVNDYPKVEKIWADVDNCWSMVWDLFNAEFMDWEYRFNPIDFSFMEGGKWLVFRKNHRKWPRRNPVWIYTDKEPIDTEANNLIADWLEKRMKEVQDAEIIARYAFLERDFPGIHRKYLFHDKELMGINAWDENWKFINYRVCIVKQDQPFLDEFMRWLFYTDSQIQLKEKLVNDGGAVDNPGLEKFKDKMNPVSKRKVFSWLRK